MRPDRTDADAMPVMVLICFGIALAAKLLGDDAIFAGAIVAALAFAFLGWVLR